MTPKDWLDVVARMTPAELRQFWHEAPAGHPVFVCGSQLYEAFEARRRALGMPPFRVVLAAGFSEIGA